MPTAATVPYKPANRCSFSAYCPELEVFQSQGDYFDEVKTNIHEAVEPYIETLSDVEKQNLL
ncbi:conserved hypothetical protein [Hyella patelloides LEGE 07179]|uniref:HicB-like antitoxin of toxin-antitoxin system domain-containing protein n=1 Tax=Hyella patelloides LEGE 07179 TaxID=945734 RepID=A0A563VWY2_9CYAN|nr:hypothetical protein [Hyella patelloides]VEP15921.1 conserved hypothetical protein [Hyella patelloides LEGE 07179]